MIAEARMSLDIVPKVVAPDLVSPHTGMGIATEDFVVVNGIPTVPDQHVQADVRLSCMGHIVQTTSTIDTLGTDAIVRFSGEHGMTTTQWHPYYNNTWQAPYFEATNILSQIPVEWLTGRVLSTAVGLVPGVNNPMRLSTLSDIAGGSLTAAFIISPTNKPSHITFDDIRISVQLGKAWVASTTQTVSLSLPPSKSLTAIGVSIQGSTVHIYSLADNRSYLTYLRGSTQGLIELSGTMSVLAIDIWGRAFNPSAHMQAMVSILSGRKS